ncbi:cytochrome P450, partial [Coniophora puteana RWD-64-598 SS2]
MWATPYLILAALCVVVLHHRNGTRRRGALPPGPLGIPFIGSAFQVNAAKPWVTFCDWRRRYGDIVHCRIWGQDTIIVNSERVARELLDKRSSNYSDKTLIEATQAFGLDYSPGFTPYSDRWRMQRRIYHQALRPEAVVQYQALQLGR